MDVPFQTAIINKTPKFTTQTISGYKKTEVTNAFEKAVKNGRIEEACTWMTELNASGLDIWRPILKISFNEINIANPFLPQFLKKHHRTYTTITTLFKKDKQIELRNNQQMRNLITDLTTTIALSNHTTKLIPIALPKLTDKDMDKKCYGIRIKAKNLSYIAKYLYQNDPSEVKLAVNEIAHLLTTSDHTVTSNSVIYWLLWIHKLDAFNRKSKTPLKTHPIKVKNISPKHHQDWIWILWKALLDIAKARNVPQLNSQIMSLFYLYKQNYTPASKQTKLPILMTTVLYLKEPVNWQVPLYASYKIRIKACAGVNILYEMLVRNLTPNRIQDATTKSLYNDIKKDVFYQEPPPPTSSNSGSNSSSNPNSKTKTKTKTKTKKQLKMEQEQKDKEKLDNQTEYFNLIPHKHHIPLSKIPPPPEISSIDEIKRLVI